MTLKYRHWFIITYDRENLEKFLLEEDYECELIYHKTRPYVMKSIIKKAADSISADDLVLEKAKFQAEAEEYSNNNRSK